MAKDVIAVFDIGKTNKKVLLFNDSMKLEFQDEQVFDEILDDDGFACDDIQRIEDWISEMLNKLSANFNIKAINISTYGASLMYLNSDGKRLTPVYNYLKPMPEEVMDNFYDTYGGIDEFCRRTASPALGMLNSGLQILWLKRKKPGIFSEVDTVLHFPQYLSYYLTGQKTSEYTSIGCHTAMWDFDKMQYHPWLTDESISLPDPVSNSLTYNVSLNGHQLKAGTGIHDSSASLAPYLKAGNDKFLLISTGTWCIFMNPFNEEPLTAGQLKKDTLCYLSVNQRQVKSSRLFLGHIHDVNVKRLVEYFNVPPDYYKNVKTEKEGFKKLVDSGWNNRLFFKEGIPVDYTDTSINPAIFGSFNEAYQQLMHDLVSLAMESIQLVTPVADDSGNIFITGGFARNDLFINFLAAWNNEKKVYTSEIDNATALGAALMVWEEAFGKTIPEIDLGLKLCDI